MKLKGLDESKYFLNEIIENKSAEPTTYKLLEVFHSKLLTDLKKEGLSWQARTHVKGITYFCSDQKAFLMLDIARRFLSCKFFTGHGVINGLGKGTWLHGGETCGSERFRIKDDKTLDRSVRFAIEAYGLAKEW